MFPSFFHNVDADVGWLACLYTAAGKYLQPVGKPDQIDDRLRKNKGGTREVEGGSWRHDTRTVLII